MKMMVHSGSVSRRHYSIREHFDLMRLYILNILGELWDDDHTVARAQEYGRQSKRNSHDAWGGQHAGAHSVIHPTNNDGWGINNGGKGGGDSHSAWGTSGAQKPPADNWGWGATIGGKLPPDAYPGSNWGPSSTGPKDAIDTYPGWPVDSGNKASGDVWPGGFVASVGQQRQKSDKRKGREDAAWGGGNQFDDLWDSNPRGRAPNKGNQGNPYEPARSNVGDAWESGTTAYTDWNTPISDWGTTHQADHKIVSQKGPPVAAAQAALLNALRALPGQPGTQYQGVPPQENDWSKGGGKKNKKNRKQQQHEQTLWPTKEEPIEYYENATQNHEQDPWSTTIGTSWGGDSYSLPSKAFALASDGRQAVGALGPKGSSQLDAHFVDSGGEALLHAERALFSYARLARNRFHWTFSPRKDERVASLLDWIELMKHGLATFGVWFLALSPTDI